jgi:hypothetical protein
MKKLTLYILACAFIACSSEPQKAKEQPASEKSVTPIEQHKVFPWLHGSWIIDYGETKIYENWKQENDHMLMGTAYVVNNGNDTVLTELMHIQKIGKAWVFIAKINDLAPVLFTSKQTESDTRLVFENAEHDFPQMVTYASSTDGLYASIDGKEKGKPKKEEYQYKRLN